MSGQTPKPDSIDLIIDGEYRSTKAERVADNLKDMWEGSPGKNFNAIADELELSDGLVRKVYYEHFGPAGGDKTFQEQDEEIEELIEKYRNGEIKVTSGPSKLDEPMEDLPIDDFEGKTPAELVGDPINNDRFEQLLSEVYRLGERNSAQENYRRGYRDAMRDSQCGEPATQ